MERPGAVPEEFDDHIRQLVMDLQVLACQTDMTRVATFMMANEGSNRHYRFIGIPDGHQTTFAPSTDPEQD